MTDDNVIRLFGHDGWTTTPAMVCSCGGYWFSLPVTADADGRITGYGVARLKCRDCGGTWPHPVSAYYPESADD